MSTVIRELLTQDVEMSTDEVLKRARTKGVTAPDKSLKDSLYNLRSEFRKAAKKAGAKPAPAAAKMTKPVTAAAPAAPAVPSATSSTPDVSAVLSNVALVNAVVGACGGVDQARKAAEAVRACGSVEAFLQHLELVAQVRGPSA